MPKKHAQTAQKTVENVESLIPAETANVGMTKRVRAVLKIVDHAIPITVATVIAMRKKHAQAAKKTVGNVKSRIPAETANATTLKIAISVRQTAEHAILNLSHHR